MTMNENLMHIFSIDLRNNAFLINEGASVAALKCFKIDVIVCLKKTLLREANSPEMIQLYYAWAM